MTDSEALAPFSRQLAAAVGSGLPLIQALDLVGQDQSSRTLRRAVPALIADLRGGSSFAEALRGHPDAFHRLYVDVVAAGEAGGHLETMLSALATMLEKQHATARRVGSALLYPKLMLTLIAVAMLVTVPDTAGKLVTGAGLAGLAWLGNRHLRRRIAAPLTDTVPLWLPILGNLYRKSSLARLTRTLGTVVSSGIPIIEALRIGATTSGSRTIHRAVMRSRTIIMRGEPLGVAFDRAKIFPPMVVSMVTTGEETGRLGDMLVKIADYYEDEVDTAVKVAISLLQPAAIVFAAGMVLALALNVL